MVTRITLTIARDKPGESGIYDLSDSFDDVLNRVVPVQGVNSALEHRGNCTHNLAGGGRVYINPQIIGSVEEVIDDE